MQAEKKVPAIFDVYKFDTVPEFAEPAPETGKYLLTTNHQGTAVSCLAGSKVPMAVYKGRKFVTSNFALLALRATLAKTTPKPSVKKRVGGTQPRRRQGSAR